MKGILALLLCGVLLMGGTHETPRSYVEGMLGVRLYEDTQIQPDFVQNTHGGFHGDGETLIRFSFEESQAQDLEEQMASGSQWNALPLPQAAKSALAYVDWPIPEAREGYWFFLDKQTGEYAQDNVLSSDYLSRHSQNWVMAMYDGERRVLYFVELDT